MPFCTNCGSDARGTFCVQCGTPVGTVAPNAASPLAATPAPVRKVSPILWVLGGIAGVIVLAGLVIISSGLFLAHKFAQNPAMATAKLLTAANPDVEVVSADEGQNTVTFRDRKTGKTVAMNFEDIKKGKIVFKADGQDAVLQVQGNGQNGTMDIHSPQGTMKFGAGNSAKVPDWVPVYPGVSPVATFSMQGNKGDGGTFQFKTSSSAKDVLSFYEQALKSAGFRITANVSGNLAAASGAMIAAENPSANRTVMVTAGTESSGATVAVVFGTNNKSHN